MGSIEMLRHLPILILVGGIPECIIIVTIIFLLLGEKLKWIPIIALGTATALLSYFIRLLPIHLYEYSFFMMALIIITLRFLTKKNLLWIIICVVLVFSFVILDDGITVAIINKLNLMDIVIKNPVARLLLGSIYLFILILAFIILKIYLKKGLPDLFFTDKEHGLDAPTK